MTGVPPPWDTAGTPTLLPQWAEDLSRTCQRYIFSTQLVYCGRSVVARRISGTGPELVITRSEDEMRTAIGLKHAPREHERRPGTVRKVNDAPQDY